MIWVHLPPLHTDQLHSFVCVPLGLPRAPPPGPPSNQSRERTLGLRDRAAAPAASGARRQWGRVTCVHTVGLSSTPAVVKSVTDGPFSEQASSEKLIDEARLHRHAVKRFFSLFLGFMSARRAEARVLGRVLVKWNAWEMPVEMLHPNPMPP